MSVALTEPVALELSVTEYDRIECASCEKKSAFLDDGDEGTQDAAGAGWHVEGIDAFGDECGCPNLCRDCADEECGATDSTPRLFGMRVI